MSEAMATDQWEYCYARGWTDGLPVVPPTATRVEAMLDALGWQAAHVFARLDKYAAEVRAEQLAATAVMAGCHPDYAPLIDAITNGLFDPTFNLQGVSVTTGGAAVLAIASGPIVERYGFHSGTNALGAGCRVNATLGRYANLVCRFCGRVGGLLDTFGVIGHPGQYSYCLSEHPATRWSPFHTQLGVAPEASVITLVAAEGPVSVNNHYAKQAPEILECIADSIAQLGSTNYYWRDAGYLIMLAPEHASSITGSFTRDSAREYIYERARRPTQLLKRVGRIPDHPREKSRVVDDELRSPVDSPERLRFIEAGGAAGKFSAVIPEWVASKLVFREVSL
jgi:hypothetical protein